MPDELARYALLITSGATALLGIVAYQRAPDRVWNRLFTVHALAVSAWQLINYLIQAAGTDIEAALWLRLSHPVVAVVVCSCVELFWTFPERVDAAPSKQRTVLYIIGIAFASLGAFPNLYTSLTLARGTVFVEYGWPFMLFGTFVMGALGYADYVLFKKRPRLTGLQRVQVNYVLVGMIISQAIAVLTMVIIPLTGGNSSLSRWGSAGYIFMVAFMAYAIGKHRIIRPVTALYRAASYMLTGAATGILLLGLLAIVRPMLARYQVPQVPVYVAVGVALGLLAVPVHRRIREALDRTLPDAYIADVANLATNAILRTLDADELPRFVAVSVANMLHATHASVFLKRAETDGYVRCYRYAEDVGESPVGAERIPVDSVIGRLLARVRDVVERSTVRRFYALEQAQELLEELRRYDAEILAPILWEDALLGIIVIGERLSAEMYSPEEVELLRNLLPQVSLALRNAELYDGMVQMKEYNDNILRQMKSGVIAIDANRVVEMLNPAAEEMLGMEAFEVMGRSVDVLPTPIAEMLLRALAGRAMHTEARVVIQRPVGDPVPVSCSASRWPGVAPSDEGAMVVMSDLTLLDELERERQTAEHLALIRVLSAGMAHEIRNPLVAIKTFAELLPTRWEDADFRGDFLTTAQEEIERIDRLLRDLMMLSKPADAVVDKVNVNAVCQNVARSLSARAESRGISLDTAFTSNGRYPLGDESRVHQALLNVVSNAVDAEPREGIVRITTEEDTGADGTDLITIRVFNANSFIPQEQYSEVFKPFYTRKPGGTGLGLAICQTIIEEHNGTIWVHSAEGVGTEFVIQLPIHSHNGENEHGRRPGD